MKTPLTTIAVILLAFAASAKDITVSPGDSLAKARDAAKAGDRVVLKGGTYRLDKTLVLGPQNSGVTWMAFKNEKPVLSGGVPVTGWRPHTNGIWKAKLNRGEKLRQLYVNGLPAQMAQRKKRVQGRGGFGEVVIKGDEPWAFTAGKRADGVKILKSDFPMVACPSDLEVRSQTTWTMNRLSVRGAVEDGENWGLLLEQPMGVIAFTQPSGTAFNPGHSLDVFNAYEFLSAPGEFYFNRAAHTLYYMPRPGEDMRTADVVAPVLETLVAVRGNNLAEHVTGVRFEGVTFTHTAWGMMKVGNSRGDCGTQACALSVKYSRGDDNGCWHRLMYATTDVPGAAVEVNAADHVMFQRNVFALTGSIGLKLENDVRDAVVEGNVFRHTGGSGLVVGHPQHVYIGKQNGNNEGFGPYNIDNSRDKWNETVEGLCQNIRIANNLLRWTCVEHSASCALTVFYGRGIAIEHNDLAYSPYSGMSVGWGWEVWHRDGNWFFPNKPSLSLQNIAIRNNKIGHVLEVLNDGGGLYMLAQQVPYAKDPAQQQWTDVSGNYIYDIPTGHMRRGIHPDNGTRYVAFTRNVFNLGQTQTIELGSYAAKGDYCFEHNYSFSSFVFKWKPDAALSPRTVLNDNTVVENNQWPEAAKQIMEKAGLEPAYRDLLK